MGGSTLFIVISVLYLVNKIEGNLIVDTDLGKIEGIEVKSVIPNEKYYSFLSIPYGQEPVGPLRFMAPKPREGWTDVLSAKKEKFHCTQFNLPIKKLANYGVFGQDDCLHLSIHTPRLPNEDEQLNFPVMVFLYNEQFRISHNSSMEYGSDFFVNEDVILVMVSHRIGASGFLAFEDELLPGNNGIRDVILALKWIQRNINKFGGDSNSVTLMGVHGGAAIADILLLSPKAKGLFHRVILQSGSSWNTFYFPKSPKQKAHALLKQLEKSSVSSSYMLKELALTTPAEVALAEPESVDADEARANQRAKLPFGPVVEPDHPDAIVTRLPEDGPINIDMPVMIGYTSREGLEMSERLMHSPQYLTFADRDFLMLFPTRDNFHFALSTDIYYKAVQEIKDFYFDEGYVKISKPGEYLTYITDIFHFYAIDYTVRKYVNESKSEIYYYMFDYSGELNLRKNNILKEAMTMEGSWGATAGDDLCYLFVCKKIKKAYRRALADEESEELNVIKNMIKLWTNFAKSGNPTPPGSDFTWTPATKENKECLVINDELQMKNNIHQDRIEFWDSFMAKYKALAVDGVIKDVKRAIKKEVKEEIKDDDNNEANNNVKSEVKNETREEL